MKNSNTTWIIAAVGGLILLVAGIVMLTINKLKGKPAHQSEEHMAKMRAAKAAKEKVSWEELAEAEEAEASQDPPEAETQEESQEETETKPKKSTGNAKKLPTE